MGKILKLFVLSLLFVSLGFSAINSFQKELSIFDREYKTATTNEMLKFHHGLKNIYIQSIIHNDKRLKIKALQRLIITSSKLGLNSASYEKELETMGKNSIQSPARPKSPSAPNIPVIDAKKLFNSSKKQILANKKARKELEKGVKGSNARIINIISQKHKIILAFDRKISNIDIRSFALKGKRTYRYVYDIGGILMGSARSIKFDGAKKVRIGQYNKNTVRLVFSQNKPLKLHYSKVDNTLHVGFKSSDFSQTTTSNTKQNPVRYKRSKPNKKLNTFNSSSKIIVIDPGHGGHDGGAKGSSKLLEKKEVLKIALRLGRDLKKRGFKIYYTRTKDKFVKLRTRTKMANLKNADLFVSIHANAAPNRKKSKQMQGIETFFLSPARSKRSKNVAALENKSDLVEMNFFSKQTFLNFLNREKIISSNKLALDVQQGMLNSLKKSYKMVDGGVREAPFWVLVGAQMPAILVEVGYITHPIEGKRIASSKYQSEIAKGIANGIDAYFAKNF